MIFRHRRRFLHQLDRARLEEAIASAERSTSGQVRVAILPRVRGDMGKIAERTASRLKMTATAERNGVLIVVVPARRTFHVWGDRAIHEKVGHEFWKSVAAVIQEGFQKGDFTGGLRDGVEEIGRRLAGHFPRGARSDGDDLPDSVVDEQ